MNCTQCQSSIPDDSKFCPECGAQCATSEINCNQCGEKNAAGARFCTGCGTTLSSGAVRGSAPASSANGFDQFAFLLSDEAVRSLTSSPVNIPYGCAAVVQVDGIIQRIQNQPPTEAVKGSIVSDFFRSLGEAARALVGQHQHIVKTFVINDYRELPFVSYVHKLKIPGTPDSRVQFNFWVEFDENDFATLGTFIQKVIGTRSSLTVQEFRKTAISALQGILSQIDERQLESRDTQLAVLDQLRKQFGISGQCSYSIGRAVGSRGIEMGPMFKPVACGSCGCEYQQKTKFCEVCGNNLTNADWVGASMNLTASGGEVVLLKLNIQGELVDGEVAPNFTDEQITQTIYRVLEPLLRKRTLESLMTGSALIDLNKALSAQALKDFQGYVSDIQISDIRSSEQDWFFKTDALVAEEIKKVETELRMLAVDESEINYQQAAFAISMRRLQQSDSNELTERRARLNTKRESLDLDLEDYDLETSTGLKKESIDHSADQERFKRDKENLLRDRQLVTELRADDRGNELNELTHEQTVEKSAATHDIELADLAGDARSRERRREIGDKAYEEEEAIRLAAAAKEKLGHIEEDLADRQSNREVSKLQAMADMEARMADQEHQFELGKISTMKGMSAQEMMAAQIAQVAKVAGADAVGSIAKSVGDSASAQEKEALLREMLDRQEKSADKLAQAQKDAMETIVRTNQDLAKMNTAVSAAATEGYKDAAKIAQTTNEKSMESMAKVATAAAARKPGKEEGSESRVSECMSCGFAYEGKKKFCPQCGEKQEKLD